VPGIRRPAPRRIKRLASLSHRTRSSPSAHMGYGLTLRARISAQLGPARTAKPHVSEPQPAKRPNRGPTQVAEVHAAEAIVAEGCTAEVRPEEVRSVEVRAAEVRAVEVRADEARIGEVRPQKDGAGEMQGVEISVGESCAIEIDDCRRPSYLVLRVPTTVRAAWISVGGWELCGFLGFLAGRV
jgi:hypothetical protein